MPKATIIYIVYWSIQNLKQSIGSTKHAKKPHKLDFLPKQVLISDVERFLYDNLAFFETFSKSGTKLCQIMV